MKKIFILVAREEIPLRVIFKCNPDPALAIWAKYQAVRPGYYMNKNHWNTITLDGSISNEENLDLIDSSHELPVRVFSKEERQMLEK